MAGTVVEVASDAELQAVCGSHAGLTVLLFWAPWHPPSTHLTKVLDAIAADQRNVRFAKVNTDVCPGLATRLGADSVPFAAFLNPKGGKVETLAGADPPRLVEKVKALASKPFTEAGSGCGGGGCGKKGGCGNQGSGGTAAPAEDELSTRLKALVNFSPVMLFMKGTKEEPFCKFSKQAVALLNKYNLEYSTFDILQDEDARDGLKEFSNWPTFPQLYTNGQFVGGVDIMKELDEEGTFLEAMPGEAQDDPPLDVKLKNLINKHPVMLFMKGDPETPRCGFSGKTCALLKEHGIEFDTFDILGDEDVRQGLKTYSNWPTFPQIYAKGKLVGGLDILKELADEGTLKEELA